jgi:hypothetical protein
VIAQTLWDPAGADTTALIRDFLVGYYGEAAPYVKRYMVHYHTRPEILIYLHLALHGPRLYYTQVCIYHIRSPYPSRSEPDGQDLMAGSMAEIGYCRADDGQGAMRLGLSGSDCFEV